MSQSICNHILLFGPELEIKRFRALFEKHGIASPNVDAFVPAPEALRSLPLNHSQNKVYGMEEWSVTARGFSCVERALLNREDAEVVEYTMISRDGNMMPFFYKVSRQFEALELTMNIDGERFYIKSGSVIPLRSED